MSKEIPKGWHIERNPKPIPDRRNDWDYWHDDYDYCTDTGDNGLVGTAASYDDALEAVIEIEEHRMSALNEEGYARYSA